MNAHEEFFSLFSRVFKLVPSFAVLATAGCLLAWRVHVPINDIPVAVAVPLMWCFLMTRAVVLVLPVGDTETPDHRRISWTMFLIGSALLLTAFLAIDFGLSAGSLYLLGLLHLARRSRDLFIFSCAAFLALSLGTICLVTGRALLRDLNTVIVTELWKIMLLPIRLSEILSRQHTFKH
jgi:hypothetical protein